MGPNRGTGNRPSEGEDEQFKASRFLRLFAMVCWLFSVSNQHKDCMKLLLGVFLVSFCLFATGIAAQQFYRWVDKDGQIHLMAVGEQRFRIEETLRERPYIIARVELLKAEVAAEVPADLVTRASTAFREYVQTAMGLRGGWSEKVEFPSDPVHLSYFIGGSLQVDAGLRQGLLETSDCAERLRNELDLLTQSTSQLKERVEQEWGRNRFSQN